jgi:hypothetical protein
MTESSKMGILEWRDGDVRYNVEMIWQHLGLIEGAVEKLRTISECLRNTESEFEGAIQNAYEIKDKSTPGIRLDFEKIMATVAMIWMFLGDIAEATDDAIDKIKVECNEIDHGGAILEDSEEKKHERNRTEAKANRLL